MGRQEGEIETPLSGICGPAPAYPESVEAAHVRYTAALQAIADRHAGRNVLVVTHGEAVRRSVARLVRMHLSNTPLPCQRCSWLPSGSAYVSELFDTLLERAANCRKARIDT